MLFFSSCFGLKKSVAPTTPLILRGSFWDITHHAQISDATRIEVVEPVPNYNASFRDIHKLFELLSKHPLVKELSLKDCYTDSGDESSIADGLANNCTLETLEVHTDKLSPQGLSTLMAGLSKNHGLNTFRVHTLSYSFNYQTVSVLNNLVEYNKSLKLIDLTACYLTNISVQLLAFTYESLPGRELPRMQFNSNMTLEQRNVAEISKAHAVDKAQIQNFAAILKNK